MQGKWTRRKLGLVLTFGAVFSLTIPGLAGCSWDSSEVKKESETNPLQSFQSATAEPAALKKYYHQSIKWENCERGKNGEHFQCAKIKVPIDYEHPAEGDFQIALNRLATNQTKPALVVNPGGPGGSGIDFLLNAVSFFPKKVVQGFNLVGFDPRGVKRSSPVDCLSDQEQDQYLATYYDLATESGRKSARTSYQDFFQKCLVKTQYREKIKFLGTKQVIQDLDIIRAVLGQDKLSYLGLSYGTQIGLEYANRFPDRVGRFVLDGVVDPALGEQEIASLQAKGFEKAFDHFVQNCIDQISECPFTSVKEAREKILAFYQKLESKPLKTNDPKRPLTRSLAETAIIYDLYSEYSYEKLAEALNNALTKNNGAKLLSEFDQAYSRHANGRYGDNSTEVLQVVNSLDYPVEKTDQESIKAGDKLVKEAPLFGRTLGYVDYFKRACDYCNLNSQRKEMTAKNVVPILLISTTHDPATPLVMAQNVHRSLTNSKLITLDSYDHTSFLTAGKCVLDPINTYLIEGKIPDKDLTCTG